MSGHICRLKISDPLSGTGTIVPNMRCLLAFLILVCVPMYFSNVHPFFVLPLALGNLDLNTLKKMSNFDPDVGLSHCGQPKYGTR
jgi:hypothetical protein